MQVDIVFLMFHAGQKIGPYTLIRIIGRGGFGEVWLGEQHAEFSITKVAVKLPLDEQVDFENVKQEADVWVQASDHPNVLPIIEANRYEGQVVFVSKYMPDGSLANVLEKNRALALVKAVEITMGVLAGLKFLHSIPIIHRDLKPANVLMQEDTPLLADFGISRALKPTDLSRSTSVVGTPPYMAPEAFEGKRNVQTDIWSVGATLYQLLSGQLPFPQQDMDSLIEAIRTCDPDPLPDSIPQPVENIVLRALAKSPAKRYQSAAEMQAELRKVMVDRVSTLIPPSPPQPNEKRNMVLAALALVVVALGLGGTIYLMQPYNAKQADGNSNGEVAISRTLPSPISSPQPTPESSTTPISTSTVPPQPTMNPTISSAPSTQPMQENATSRTPSLTQSPTNIRLSEPETTKPSADPQRASAQDDEIFRLLLREARVLLDNTQPAPAYNRYERALRRLPNGLRNRVDWGSIAKARLSYGREQFPEAAKQFEAAFRKFPRQ